MGAVAHSEDDMFDRHVIRLHAALRRLLRCPAPGLSALALKIDLVVDQDVATLSGGEDCLAALKRDARRLAGPAAAAR